MMELSKELQVRIRDEIRVVPLGVGEIRRLVGLGEMYVSDPVTHIDGLKYIHLFDLLIDTIRYRFYRKK